MTGSLSQATLTDRAILAGSEALAGRRRGLRSLLPFAGPAVIASVAYMDPGNFATNIQAGAKYDYNLLWVVVVANIIAIVFQALSAKLGIVTGRDLAVLCREQFARPMVWGMWVGSEIGAMATDLAEFLGGQADRRHGAWSNRPGGRVRGDYQPLQLRDGAKGRDHPNAYSYRHLGADDDGAAHRRTDGNNT